MSYLSLLITLIGGIGIGSVIQVVIANRARKKELFENRTYKEMRNSYIGLLNSLHNAAVNPSDKSSKEYALWQTRVELFGSSKVSKYVQDIIDTNPGSQERNVAFNSLISSMRADLGIRKPNKST
ncbi:MAG: hypothetical protein LHW59_05055 [Candidatus Cloacimonetes bacterium]|jgi:hypothetical protein|nr:hypothetical protein [Candidatus Cloacimonadota bacterium]